MLEAGPTQTEIARALKRHPFIISREIWRNRGRQGYRPFQAQQLATARQQAARYNTRIDAEVWAWVHVSPKQSCPISPKHECPTAKRRGH